MWQKTLPDHQLNCMLSTCTLLGWKSLLYTPGVFDNFLKQDCITLFHNMRITDNC